jgi:hypothetical protein
MQSTARLLKTTYRGNKANSRSTTESESSARLPLQTVQELNTKATVEIENIVRRKTAGDPEYRGYDEAEIIAAKALLDGGS